MTKCLAKQRSPISALLSCVDKSHYLKDILVSYLIHHNVSSSGNENK